MARFFITALVRLIPMAAAIASWVYVDSLAGKIGAVVAGTFLTLLLDYIQLVRPQRKQEKLIEELLSAYFKVLSNQALKLNSKATLRFSVLVPKRLWRTAFISVHLFQRHQYNMSGEPDVNLHFPIDEGVAGYAIRASKQQVYFVDLEKYTPERLRKEFRCSKKLLDATVYLKAIAAVPLYGKSIVPRRNQKLIGVLCADTQTSEGVLVLSNADTQESIKNHALLVEITLRT